MQVACPDRGWTIDLRTGEAEASERGVVRTFAVMLTDAGIFVSVPSLGTGD